MKIRLLDASPYFFEGGDTGVLLLHGFTGTPQCMMYPAKALSKAGFTVLVPLIDGHGTHYEDLAKTTWQDWYKSAEQSYQALRAQCKTVVVAGLSMGGLMACLLAHHHHEKIKALALLATPLFLDGFLVKGLFPTIWKTPIRHIYKYQTKIISSIADPQARRLYRAYEKVPVASVAALLELQKEARRELKHVHQPTLIMHSLRDETVPYGNLDYIKAIISSEVIKTVTLKKSDHIITVDYEKDIVAKELIKFFKKYGKE